jgi:hypothetical protein
VDDHGPCPAHTLELAAAEEAEEARNRGAQNVTCNPNPTTLTSNSVTRRDAGCWTCVTILPYRPECRAAESHHGGQPRPISSSKLINKDKDTNVTGRNRVWTSWAGSGRA